MHGARQEQQGRRGLLPPRPPRRHETDRMNQDATSARFLGAIGERVPAGRVEEVHLFQPLRQGGAESRVAVVAVREPDAPPAESEGAESTAEMRAVGNPQPGRDRRAVYTARYRLTLKGPDRGKWDFTMQAEADAPLVTVDAVVRGVQRRSGDVEEPSRLTGDEFRALLGAAPA